MTDFLDKSLLPCPFCGSPAEWEYTSWNDEDSSGDDGSGWVECTGCYVQVPCLFRDEADERWNRRSQSPAAVPALTSNSEWEEYSESDHAYMMEAEEVGEGEAISPAPVKGRRETYGPAIELHNLLLNSLTDKGHTIPILREGGKTFVQCDEIVIRKEEQVDYFQAELKWQGRKVWKFTPSRTANLLQGDSLRLLGLDIRIPITIVTE